MLTPLGIYGKDNTSRRPSSLDTLENENASFET